MIALMMIIAGIIVLGCYYVGIHYIRKELALRFFHTLISLALVTPFVTRLLLEGGIPC